VTVEELLIRDAAAEWLKGRLRDSSKSLTGSSWACDWEYHAWSAQHPDLEECSGIMRDLYVGNMVQYRRLGEALGGWWVRYDGDALKWEPLETWLVMVDAWQAQQGKDGG